MPPDPLRKHLSRRHEEQISLINKHTPKRLQKSPSQKHSEALRKKLARGTKADPEPPGDCWECPKKCGLSLKVCREQSIIGRCPKCGDRYRYRITDKPWVACVRCRENGKV